MYAFVRFEVDGVKTGFYNNDCRKLKKDYCFNCPDLAISAGDYVIVETKYGYHVGTVMKTGPYLPDDAPKNIEREVVCKVNFVDYYERKVKKEHLRQIKKAMDKKVSELKEQALYEALAEKDEELNQLLMKYRELNNESKM